MKNSICGFNQQNAVAMGLTSDDLIFLRWFVDFSHSPKMKKRTIDGEVYYWISYGAVLKDLPILNVSKAQLRRRILSDLVKTGVLTHKQVRETGPAGGTFAYFGFGKAYEKLIESDFQAERNSASTPCDKKAIPPAAKMSHPCGKNVTPPVSKMSQQRSFSYITCLREREREKKEKSTAVDGVCEKGSRQTGKAEQRDERRPFSTEMKKFAEEVFPSVYEKITGYTFPAQNPYQYLKAMMRLSGYLRSSNKAVAELESEAEAFLKTAGTNGSLTAFANSRPVCA
jgi:hypothetical protein